MLNYLLTGLYFLYTEQADSQRLSHTRHCRRRSRPWRGHRIERPGIASERPCHPRSGFVSGPWDGFYTALYQVNSLIVALDKLAASQSRNEILGVASFFRGLIYYHLVSRYGEVPILEAPFSGDIAASTEEEGWSFVEKNFQVAIDYAQLSPTSITSPNRLQRL